MSLDSVALVVDIENKFGINIPDDELEQIGTVAELADAVFNKIMLNSSDKCLTQIIFYRIRKAINETVIEQLNIHPQSKISDILTNTDIKLEWANLESKLKLKLPRLVKLDLDKNLEKDVKLFGVRIYSRTEAITECTISKLIDWIISLNSEKLIPLHKVSSKYEVERIIAGIINETLGVPINKIELNSSLVNDLGID